MANIQLRRGLREFVPASFPVPQNPILVLRSNWDPSARNGFGDFIPAYFPVPNNPITGMAGMGCGCGCSDCNCGGGMGDIPAPAWASHLPDFMQGSMAGVPKVYWAIGGVVGVVAIAALAGGRRRR